MRTISKLVPLVLFGGVSVIQACGSTKYEDQELPNGIEFAVKGVIRGTALYSGPPPCSQNGHIVGNGIILVFDRRNPPPPSGLANTAINFTVVSGDNLFANWPRTAGPDKICPDTNQSMTVTAPFAVAPMDPGSYLIQAFFDYTGNFLPTFKMRNLPEATDVGGGYIDINDANALVPSGSPQPLADGGSAYGLAPKQADPNYQPVFLPVDVGVAGAIPADSRRGVPEFTMPPNGFLADNITVSMGVKLGLARPYFYPEAVKLPKLGKDGPEDPLDNTDVIVDGASDSRGDGTKDDTAILKFPASLAVYAAPSARAGTTDPDIVNQFQAKFPQLRLRAGVPAAELASATNLGSIGDPFHMQIGPTKNGNGGIYVWWDGNHGDPLLDNIPEGQVPKMWPLIVLAKLQDYKDNKEPPVGGNLLPFSASPDPQGIVAQGSDPKNPRPVVIIQGITIAEDSLLWTTQHARCIDNDPVNGWACSGISPDTGRGQAKTQYKMETRPNPATNLQDHVTVLVRPSALCIDPRHFDRGGILVTPHVTGQYPPADTFDSAGAPDPNNVPVVDISSLRNSPQLKPLVRDIREACIPPGRYGINMVYPTGQAWTTPNEAGRCAALEGASLFDSGNPGTCGLKSRPVLYSQGTRAVVEVTDDTGYCKDHPVIHECVALDPE